jgi:CXXX repeat modification system protein
MRTVGRVGPAEVEEIRALHGRKVALKELVYSMGAMRPEEVASIYERVVTDLAQTCLLYDAWWSKVQATFGESGVKLELDFATGEVFVR